MTAPDPAQVLARVLRRLEPGERRAYLQSLLENVVTAIMVMDYAEATAETLDMLAEKVRGR